MEGEKDLTDVWPGLFYILKFVGLSIYKKVFCKGFRCGRMVFLTEIREYWKIVIKS